jgi:hypothetical protein
MYQYLNDMTSRSANCFYELHAHVSSSLWLVPLDLSGSILGAYSEPDLSQ